MKSRTDLEKEYKEFKIKSTFVKDLDDFITFIEVMQFDLSENDKVSRKEIKYNKRWKFEVRIRNYFLALINEREEDVFDEDTAVLMEVISADEEYGEFLDRILKIVNSSNYKELLKLVEFTNTYYDKHIEFLEKQRETLELELRGIHLVSPSIGADKDELSEFIRSILNKIEAKEAGGTKQYVKRG